MVPSSIPLGIIWGTDMGAKRTAAQKLSYGQAERRADRYTTALRKQMAANEDNGIGALGSSPDDERWQWAQRVHASRRAEERYGVQLDAKTLRELADRMSTGQTMQEGMFLVGHVDDGSRRASIWLVFEQNAELPVVFDHNTRQIVTVLPLESYKLQFDRRDRRFHNLVNGGTKAARTYWSQRA
tara:strand:- start:98 stop:649 length:552 start_codon:yes stop_codon:yes gene_type:complete